MKIEPYNFPTYDPTRLEIVVKEADELLLLENHPAVEFESNLDGDILYFKLVELASDQINDLLYMQKVIYDGAVKFLVAVNVLNTNIGAVFDTVEEGLAFGIGFAQNREALKVLYGLTPNAEEVVRRLADMIERDDPALGTMSREDMAREIAAHNSSKQDRAARLTARRQQLQSRKR
jgi:hypothetical protein